MSSLIGNGPQQVPTNGDLGTMAFQDKESVKIEGGTINGMAIGATTPAAGKFTTFSSTGASQLATSTGNVLIGTTTDDVVNKLQVNGGISSTDLTVTGGTVTLPSTTSIGNVSSTELGYLDGVTSAVQTQLNSKAALASPAFTGTPTAPTAATGTNTTQVATAALVKATGDTKALLAGSATQDFTAKTLTATTVNANNIGDIVQQQGVVTTYAASGSTGIQIANNDNLNFGTGDFTLVWKGSLPDWTPPATAYLHNKYTGGSSVYYGTQLTVSTNGNITLTLYRADSGTPCTFSSPLWGDNTQHALTYTVVRETTTTAGSVTLYADGVLVATWVLVAQIPGTVTNTLVSYYSGVNGIRIAATTQAVYAYNRALSAAEVLSLYRNGVAESDKWGSQTERLLNNDFEGAFVSGVASSWACTGTGSEETTLVRSGTKSQKCVATAAGLTGISQAGIGIPGATFTTSVWVYCTSARTFRVQYGADVAAGPIMIAANTWTELKTTNVWRVTNTATQYTLYLVDGVIGDVFYVDSASVIKVGAVLALEPEGIQPAPGQWLDSSTNKLNALQPATGSSLTRKKEDFEIRWTNTWAGTHEAQYVGGINQAVLPPNCYIESIIGVVSGTVIEDIILGDGVDTDRWVTITTGLSTGTQTFAIANRVSDGTNRKLVVDPDANFTGSISWVIKGIIL